AMNKGAKVLNMSFGSYAQSLAMGDALANAYSTTLLVAASGNDGMDIGDCPPGGPFYPAALSYVLGVMAPDGGFSNSDCTGPTFSLSAALNNYEMKAPGTNILSTIPNGNYRVYQGTSMAAPILSGSLAMYKILFPTESHELMWVKFIQTTTTFFNIDAAIICVPVPEIRPISRTMVDTITGDDDDGRVDAGETIQIWFTARNTGGQCDSTWFKIRFHEFEDTTTAQILKPLSFIGSMSPYATLTSQFDPMKIHFSPDIAHDRDVVFDLLFWYKDSPDTTVQQVVFTVENGEQLAGVMDSIKILYPNRLYLVNNSFKVGVNGTLIIRPGAKMLVYPGRTIPINGRLIADGTPDSLINIVGYGGGVGTVFSYRNDISIRNHISYCKFENLYWPLNSDNGMNPASVYNCIFLTNFIGVVDSVVNNLYYSNSEAIYISRSGYVYKNNFIAPSTSHDYYFNGNCPYAMYAGGYQLINNNFINFRMPPVQYQNTDNNRVNSWISEYSKPTLSWDGTFWVEGRQILVKHNTSSQSTADFEYVEHQYWGTNDPLKIEGFITDFMENPTWPKAVFLPKLTSPPDSCHAVVWKILVNGIDPQDEHLDPIGEGIQKFDVYFNRPMDSLFQPQLTFGVRYPFTQQTVSDSGQWSPDYKIWTAYKNIQLYTGDGINRIRVSGAKDLEGWEIPVDDMRFEFVIAAAGSASTNFMAQAGIGKVDLEWNNAGIEDLLGFNMYRFKNLTDTTYSDPVLINTTLITDTVYTDFAVIPNEHYWYYYKVVNTDFHESDSSNFVNVIPYNAPTGDANGDGLVNVLDITAIISYMLSQNPQPFLFDAADVNNDNAINILDVIGVVNLINGTKSSIPQLIGTHPLTAYIKMDGDQIELRHNGQIASMQFELLGENLE
ncbi:MAG: S8 family serine peptidase, partial [Bacteroidales bacterium]